MKNLIRFFLRKFDVSVDELFELQVENDELRNLVAEMLYWTKHKNTDWAKRAAKVLKKEHGQMWVQKQAGGFPHLVE